MKLPFTLLLIAVAFAAGSNAQARKTSPAAKTRAAAQKTSEIGQSAVVVDETLSVLRKNPSLFSESVHRMQRGRKVQITGVTEADGVKFYKVNAPPSNFGWVQADAVFGRFRAGDEERLSKLVQALDGFDQIEAAAEFFSLYPDSRYRPTILLLFGDLLEEVASKLSIDAGRRLSRKEMAASAAPMHSYYLNFNMLDRYRRLGVIFLFNSTTRQFHYDGASWREVAGKYSKTPEAAEAQKRLDSLKQKMDSTAAK